MPLYLVFDDNEGAPSFPPSRTGPSSPSPSLARSSPTPREARISATNIDLYQTRWIVRVPPTTSYFVISDGRPMPRRRVTSDGRFPPLMMRLMMEYVSDSREQFSSRSYSAAMDSVVAVTPRICTEAGNVRWL